MRKTIFLLIVICCSLTATSQTILFEAPRLANKEAKLYYYAEAKIDSLVSRTDAMGNVQFRIASGDYCGLAGLKIGDTGMEFVVNEPKVKLSCRTDRLDKESIDFSASNENSFLERIFNSQARYAEQEAWLDAGKRLFPINDALKKQLEMEYAAISTQKQKLDEEMATSKLYAARYYNVADFFNRLFSVEQARDVKGAKVIQSEMESQLDIAALYSSGQLWGSTLNFYISLFNRTQNEDIKQQKYAESVLKTSERLSAPYFDAFLAGCISETERFGWIDAQRMIVGRLLTKFKGFTSTYPVLQRAIGSYRVSQGQALPPIVGLNQTKDTYDRILVAFHDSDCSTCLNEMTRLMQLYSQLREKGVRVVSVAADTNKKEYEKASARFPWSDKLCDLKGFNGVNFSNYNVVGAPAFYLTDTNGKLLGLYFNISDLLKEVNTDFSK